MGAGSSDNSEWNIDDKWSSQEWKSGEMLLARTGRPVGGQPFTQHTHNFVIDDDDSTDLSGQEILYLRALQGHSGRNLIDPSLQDNV